jgi:N-acetyl-anhydromuramyl-L-alanine amidase AmpD
MATRIRPNRLEVNDRFPMLGFTVRTDGNAKRYEIAIGTSPDLFSPDGKTHRSRSNFYSTRGIGPLPIERGEAVYVLPLEVLARFVGQTKLYYGLATVGNGNGTGGAEVATMPESGSPYINISGLSGRSLQRVRLLPNRQRLASNYGKTGSEMDWAGDAMMPASQPAMPAASKNSMPSQEGKTEGSVHYDDGYGPLPPPPPTPIAPKPDTHAQAKSLADDDSGGNQDATRGINGPIPDADAAAQSLARSLAIAPEYPGASRFVPANSGNFRAVKGTRTIKRIVIHITDGQSKLNGTVGWFQDPSAKVSAHYVVGQDGEVVQMVKNNDIAWHASSANSDSIGIEHVARSPHEWDKKLGHADPGMMPTDEEYCGSAALVNWLCNQFNLPMDRDHIMGHSEADPKTTHTDCPNAVWDWDYYMGLVTSGTCTPRTASASSLGADDGQSFDENWNDVEVLGQPDQMSCWATSGAMLAGWRDQLSLDIEAVRKMFSAQTGLASSAGLSPGDRQKLADVLGLVSEPPQSYTVDGFRRILENYGPVWVGILTEGGGGHAVVVTGMYGDGTPDKTFVRINDPWGRDPGTPGSPGKYTSAPGQGSRYVLTFAQFEKEYEDRITMSGKNVNVQILHAADNGGRTIGTGATQTYALAAPASARRSRPQSYAAQAADDGDDQHGIEGPVPDEVSAAQALALSPEYPQASRFEPADSANFHALSQPRTINRVVIHITDGGSKINGTVGWFKNPAAKVSAHYVIGQDGEVVQMVRHNDVAWHASSANGDSIGIEHVANTRGLKPTPAQYCASAALVSWLASQFGLPTDRTHVLGHSEADPKTSHTACPNAVWDWDYYMGMVTSQTCYEPQTQSLSVKLPPAPRKHPGGRSLAAAPDRMVGNSAVQTVVGGEGNITWELDQFPGVKIASANAAAPLQSAETIELSNWPYCDHTHGGRASAWFDVDWKFSGQTLGQVRITPAGSQQGSQPLRVEARIEDGMSRDNLASLLVRFTYHFATAEGPEIVALTELRLYSDGSIDQNSKWTSQLAA